MTATAFNPPQAAKNAAVSGQGQRCRRETARVLLESVRGLDDPLRSVSITETESLLLFAT